MMSWRRSIRTRGEMDTDQEYSCLVYFASVTVHNPLKHTQILYCVGNDWIRESVWNKIYKTVADPGFPGGRERDSNNKGGRQPNAWHNVHQKLHENKNNWTVGGVRITSGGSRISQRGSLTTKAGANLLCGQFSRTLHEMKEIGPRRVGVHVPRIRKFKKVFK